VRLARRACTVGAPLAVAWLCLASSAPAGDAPIEAGAKGGEGGSSPTGVEVPRALAPEQAATTPPSRSVEPPGRAPVPAGGGATYARVWVGVSVEAPELLFLPGGNGLCQLTAAALPVNSTGYYCTNPDGTDFPSRSGATQNANLSPDPSQSGHVAAGLRLGDVRAMVLFDYALSPSFLVGARLGYVFNAYPGQAAVTDRRAFGPKIHLEARATYLFGGRPLEHRGYSPMVFAGLGLAEFDGHTAGSVTLANLAGQQPVNIWLTDGPYFLVVGGGIRYQFSLRTAFTLAVRANVAFGVNGVLPTYGPEIGFQYGF